MRIDTPASKEKIRMDDWKRASADLPGAAEAALDKMGKTVAEIFLKDAADPYEPLIDFAQ